MFSKNQISLFSVNEQWIQMNVTQSDKNQGAYFNRTDGGMGWKLTSPNVKLITPDIRAFLVSGTAAANDDSPVCFLFFRSRIRDYTSGREKEIQKLKDIGEQASFDETLALKQYQTLSSTSYSR